MHKAVQFFFFPSVFLVNAGMSEIPKGRAKFVQAERSAMARLLSRRISNVFFENILIRREKEGHYFLYGLVNKDILGEILRGRINHSLSSIYHRRCCRSRFGITAIEENNDPNFTLEYSGNLLCSDRSSDETV